MIRTYTCHTQRYREQENKLKLARVPLPTFSGEMQDYLMFKDDWTMLVARELDNASKLC